MAREIALTLLALLLVGTLPAWAEATPDGEADQAAKEQAYEDAKGSENFQILFNGKLLIGNIGEAVSEGVVGAFICDKHAYQLKLQDPALLQKLTPHNGKMVTLKGRPRNNGKYFIASDLSEAVANPVVPHKRSRGGL
jgi:hypothetical protein